MAFTMACSNFKKGLKMAYGPLGVKLIPNGYIIEWHSCQCKAIFGAIMNFLVFRLYAFIISKRILLPFFELFKNEAALKVW
jgi:hypothetical protein